MAQQNRSVLIVEDLPTLAQAYEAFLSRDRLQLAVAGTGAAALKSIFDCPPDAILLDVNLPDMNGLDILREIKRRALSTEVVMITSNGSINLAIEAMREGAYDFIVKPCTADRLRATVRNALERRAPHAVTVDRSKCGVAAFCGFIGQSPPMQAIYRTIQSAAPSKATVFVTGESGTGKEVCAEALHHLSKRRQGPFVAVNCAAIPRDLLESELFGHVKGAFTGATTDRLGAAMRADGGTLFLDEIGELDIAFQAKLLRFLQTGQVQRIGDDRLHEVDVRIVCATNRDPRAEVAAGRFREDLFYRLYVIPIELPPLRARGDDALLLARAFLAQYANDDDKTFTGFTSDAQKAMLQYDWPGNIRELQNVIRKIVVLGLGPQIGVELLPAELMTARSARVASQPADASAFRSPPDQIVPLDETIDRAIKSAIALCQGSIPKAAFALKVSPSTLYRRLQSAASQ